MSSPRNSLKLRVKRVLLFAALGFVANWFITLAVLEIPRRVSSNRVNKSLMIDESPESETRSFVNIYEYRWFGVFERQYTKKKQSFIQNPSSNIQFWWTWNVPSEPFVNHLQQWEMIQLDYDSNKFPTPISQYSQMRVGWPALSFESQGAVNPDSTLPDGSFTKAINGAVVTSVIDQSKYFLGQEPMPMVLFVWFPYQPIWSGMALNTILYGLLFSFISSTNRAYCHARRMRRGCCPMCNYDLSFDHSHGCSECGWRKA
jgi:hypothetical protein